MHTDRKRNTDNNNKHAVQTFNVQQDIFQQTNSQRQKHKLVGVGNNNKKNQKNTNTLHSNTTHTSNNCVINIALLHTVQGAPIKK